MGFLEDRDLTKVPRIPEYYKGKTIFVTGGSGFIGKVLVEKLLYSCPELDRIYLLMRSKKGVGSKDRLAHLYSLPCFDRLRAEKPEIFESKVFVVAGDVGEPGLGLTEEDRMLLVNKVNIVFHVAASVRFDNTLTYAAKLNLQGTKEMMDLVRDFKKLSAFVHVSTSYSNTNRDPVEEVMYPPHADWRETLDICEKMDEHTIRMLTPKYLGKIPNTYTFTKQLAEHVVYEQRGRLPAVIIRPSIVISSIKEPVPAWIESFNGPVGIFVACGKGIMRSVHTKSDIILDFIPVDSSVKHIIAAAWIRGTAKIKPEDDIPIYNCCSGNLHQILMGDLVNMSKSVSGDVPLNGALWRAGGTITSDARLHYCKVLVQHLLPAVLVDMMLWLLGKKTMLVKVQRRIFIAGLALSYYTMQQWTFCNKNFVALRSTIKPEDQDQFSYEIENIDAKDYFKTCCYGGRRYLLNEKDDDLPQARVHYQRLVFIDELFKFIFYGCLVWWLWKMIAHYFGDSLNELML